MNDRGEQTGRAMPDGGAVPPRRGRGPSLLAALAVIVAALGFGFPGSGCLNPRPEELPSGANGPTVERETCEDNPLLAGCELPETDINDDPISPGSTDDGDAPAESFEPPANMGGQSAPPDGGGDAGLGAADAGAL